MQAQRGVKYLPATKRKSQVIFDNTSQNLSLQNPTDLKTHACKHEAERISATLCVKISTRHLICLPLKDEDVASFVMPLRGNHLNFYTSFDPLSLSLSLSVYI